MDGLFDRIARFAVRYERVFTIGGAIWLAVSCAAWARFVELPDIPFLTDRNAWMVSGAYNAIWWGFVHPQIDRHRKALADAREATEPR